MLIAWAWVEKHTALRAGETKTRSLIRLPTRRWSLRWSGVSVRLLECFLFDTLSASVCCFIAPGGDGKTFASPLSLTQVDGGAPHVSMCALQPLVREGIFREFTTGFQL